MFGSACKANIKTEEMCLSWLKPEGGNEINIYIIEWIIEHTAKHIDTIPYNGMESNNYTIRNLRPAQAVNVSIRASNSAGEGEVSWEKHATGRTFIILPNVTSYFT